MHPTRLAPLLAVILCPNPAVMADDAPGTAPAFTMNLRGTMQYGWASGFAQTPAGGQPGSSSHGRPSLEELGIRQAISCDALAGAQWRHLGLYAGVETLDMSASETLTRTLISQNSTFPAGTRVRSEIDLDWVRFGGGWKVPLARGKLELFPKLEFAVLDFDYSIAGGGVAAHRGYPKGTVRCGGEARYRVWPCLSLALDAEASLPLSNTPQIAVLNAAVELDLLPRSRRFHPELILGAGVQRIDYEDNQKLPNHFRVDLGPYIKAGVQIRF